MKKFFYTVIALCTVAVAVSQTKPVAKKPVAATANPLKTKSDSLSYAVGMSLASFYKQQGIKTINTQMIDKAINDVMKSNKPLFTEEQMQTCITSYMQEQRAEKSAGNRKAGEAFLAANKSKPGIITTASGIQYQVIKQGDGAKPTVNDKVRCHYHGTLIDGTVFDSSVDRGQPAEFPVGGVIPGWVEILQLMPVGSKWKVFIPSNLAYGDNPAGKIPAGSVLIFEIELLAIVQ